MKIVQDKKYPEMYRVKWPNGDISVDTAYPDLVGGHYRFYNKTRAKDFLLVEGIEKYERHITYRMP